ncbi:MAG: tripartite tricarboxylate transporter substrate-binding protein, partial [Proteobacteria bacterium]|nr:tripartite tricarboxylate transporter substrate-binding protein [Pseudomonadota bacterium]
PSRSITIVSPFAPGGPNDVIARLMAAKLSDTLGVAVVVENRGGAGGTVGTGYVARAVADGHVLLLGGPSSLAIAPHLYAKLTYDALRDFSPITNVAATPYVVAVNPRVPARTIPELLKVARSKPQALSFGSSGAGSISHLGAEMLAVAGGAELVHVPYKGTVPSITGMVSGEVDMMIADLGLVDALARAGKLRLLANAGRGRSSVIAQVPTMLESGFKDFVMEGRFGMLAPAGTPRETVMRLHGLLVAAVRSTEVRERFAQLGYEPATDTPEQYASMMRLEHERFGRLIRQLKIVAQ